MKDAASRRRRTAKIGKYSEITNTSLFMNRNGYKGRSQKGCFGNHVNSMVNKKEK